MKGKFKRYTYIDCIDHYSTVSFACRQELA